MELGHLHPVTGDPELGCLLGKPRSAGKVAGGVVAPAEQPGLSPVVETAACFSVRHSRNGGICLHLRAA